MKDSTRTLRNGLCAHAESRHLTSVGQPSHGRHYSNRGAAVAELLVAILGLSTLSLGLLQGALVFNAKTTLNYATFEAARAGAVNNAQRTYMTEALARGLLPLYGGGSDTATLTVSNAKAYADLMLPVVPNANVGSGSRLEILGPTQEAFQDWGIDINGQQQIPNEHLRFKDNTVGAKSGVSIQDANILKLKVTYGFKLYVPFINRVIAGLMKVADPANAAFYQADPPRLPIVAQATLRMQSNPYPDKNASSSGPGGPSAPPGGPSAPPGGPVGPGPVTGPTPTPTPGPVDPCANGGCSIGDPKTCSNSTPAAQPAQTPSVSVGNPINVVTGNKYQSETDLTLSGILAPEFSRYYNSRSEYHGRMGYGWTHTYSASLDVLDDKRIAIQQADGRTIVFRKEIGDSYKARLVDDGQITSHKNVRVWHWRNGRKLTFDNDGKLLRIEAPGGEALSLTYDRSRLLVQVSDNQERRLAFGYYSTGRLQYVLDPAGAKYLYTYDEHGNLATATAPDNSTRVYRYEDRLDVHNLTGITDGRGVRYATYAYDDQDRAILSTHANNVGKVVLKFSKDQTTVINSFGKPSLYRTRIKDGIPLVTSVEGPGCSACGGGEVRYEYNQRLQLTSTTARSGVRNTYDYDEQGRVIRIREQANGQTRVVTRMSYEGSSEKPSVIAHPSVVSGQEHVYALHYDSAGHVTNLEESGFSPEASGRHVGISRTYKMEYKNGQLASYDGPRTDVVDVTHFKYDSSGRMSVITAPDGLEHRILSYDQNGRPTQMQRGTEQAIALNYDTVGRVLQVSQGAEQVQYTYSGDGRVETVVGPDKVSLHLVYDDAGRAQGVADSFGNRTAVKRDTEDNPLTQIALDANNQVLRSVSFVYDAESRLKAVQAVDGKVIEHRKYNAAGNLAEKTDAAGNTTRFQYGPFGELQRLVEPGELITRFGYEQNRLTAITDAAGHTTKYNFDDFGRAVEIRSPDSGVTRYQYDASGNRIQSIDARGQVTRYAYDTANRPITRTSPDGNEQLRYENGRLVAIDGPGSSEQLVYDTHGRISKHVHVLDGLAFTTSYQYDERSGKLREKTLPGGEVLRYQYDDATGRLKAVSRRDYLVLKTPIIENLAYQPFGPVTSFTSGNGVRTSYSYSHGGALREINSEPVLKLNYSYDSAGNINGVQRTVGRETPPLREVYRYDATRRMVEAKNVTGEYSYGYDSVGNRIQTAQTASKNSQSVLQYEKGSNRLASISGASQPPARYQYDATGSPIEAGKLRYEYNAAHRPVRLFVENQLKAEYSYNSRGERIKKVLHEHGAIQAVYFIYENGQLLAEADTKGQVTAQYLYLGYRPIAKLEAGNIYAIHTDQIGLPSAATDEAGRIVWNVDYAPFGKAFIKTETITLNLRNPGQYADKESGNYYNFNRDYSPETGRFLTADPSGLPDGPNPYVYAKNDPLFLADPLGLATLTYFIIDGTQGGAIAGGQQYWGFGLAIGDTRVIYDPYGSFINSSSNPLGASSASYITWLQSNVTTFGTPDPQKAFNNYYIYDIFSPPSFTVSNLDDTAAREIIRQLNLYGKLQDYYYCLNGPTPVLPSIMLLPRPETAGAATKPVALQPGKLDGWDVPNDTLTCLQAMTPRQRFNRIKAAITQQESSGTCTPTVMQRTGCPGNISNATGWTGTSGAAGSTAASFGQTQYTLVTFLSELQGMAAGPSTKKNATPISDPRLTPAQLAALGFNDPAKNLAINIKLALTRASSLNNAWRVTLNSNYNLVALATDQVTIRAFANATGIGLAQITASNNFTIALDAMTRIVLWNKIMALTNTYRVQSNGATYVAVDGRSYSTAFQLMEVALVDPANPAAGTVLTKLKGYLDQLGLSYLQFNPYMKTNIWNESWNAFMNQAIRSVSAVEALLFGTNGMMMTPERFDWVADAVLYRQIDLYLSKYPNATEQDIAALAAYYHNRGVNAPSIAAAYALGYGASVANIWQQLPCTTMNVKGIVLNDNAPKP